MEPTLDQLRVFHAVAETGSFSGAARRLRRVQSAISYAIAQLEQQLELTLFDRGGRLPALTDAGRALLVDTRDVLRRVDDLRVRARSFASGTEPRVAIAADAMMPMPIVIDAVRSFHTEMPHVSLSLYSEALGGVAQLVLEGVCRIGIGGPLERFPAELEREAIGSFEMGPVVSSAHPLAAHRGRISDRALRDHVQIVLTDRTRLTEGIDRGVIADRTFRVADLSAKRALIEAGIGWGGMPLHAVSAQLEAGTLVRIQPASMPAARFDYPLYAITHRAHALGPAARWMVERFRALLGQPTPGTGTTAPRRASRGRARRVP